MTERLAYPEKESAVIGFLGASGFRGIPPESIANPETFTSTLNGVFYAAAINLHMQKRPVLNWTIIEEVEKNKFWLKAVQDAASEAGMPDWRDGLAAADKSMVRNPDGGLVIGEFLQDIADAASKRTATHIGGRLARAEISPQEASEELQKVLAPRKARMHGVEVHSFEDLWKYKPEADPSALLGDRWVCQGGQLLLVGQSGVGKSSLTVQAAMMWALGLPFFGIKPARALRSLFIQAENDAGDMAEIVQGVMSYVVASAKMPQPDAVKKLKENVVFVRVTAQTGEAFVEVVRELLEKHGPMDLVFGDPLLSYIGDDISQQAVTSHFLRGLCNPLAFEHKFAWVWSHHTGKPQSDSKSRQHWNANDFAYIGLGSSELTNWARAICVLQTTKHDGIFKLLMAKRGRRANICDSLGHPTIEVVLKHADQGLHWEPSELPEEPEQDHNPKQKHGRPPALSPLQEAELIAMQQSWPNGKRGFYEDAAKRFKVSRDTIERFFTRQKKEHETNAAK
jgi:hypothetical protein